MIDNTITKEGDREVTKWEVINDLQKKIVEARGEAEFCRERLERNEPIFGGGEARMKQHLKEADEAERLLEKILLQPIEKDRKWIK